MEKNVDWFSNLSDAVKVPFQKMYDLIFTQDNKIKELEQRLAEAENKIEVTETKLNQTEEMAKKAVIRAEKAESKLERLENKNDLTTKFIGSIVESQGFD